MNMHIEKDGTDYIGYKTGEKNVCMIRFMTRLNMAYIHNMPVEYENKTFSDDLNNSPQVVEKIYFAIEEVNDHYCDDEDIYKGKGLTTPDGKPLTGNYSVTSWFEDEDANRFGDSVPVGLLELEIDDVTGTNGEKVVAFLADYAEGHDFWLIYEEWEEAYTHYQNCKRYRDGVC